jgi:transcriptional regulator with XRE-family HTH domain
MRPAHRPVDVHIGSQIRLRRTVIGMSREQLGERVGASAAEMEEYEAGHARVSPGVLLDMADALRIPVSSFFADSYPVD